MGPDQTAVLVGTCGYGYYSPGAGWKETYESKLAAFADEFSLLELNSTFYELPQVSTARRWRREVCSGFAVTTKAWQAITHPAASPTWNGHREALPDAQDDVGYLSPTAALHDAWDATRERAEAVAADVVVLQTPPSFDASPIHEANLHDFLSSIDRGGLTLAWEPRGDWREHPDRVAAIAADHDLVHVVDPFRDAPQDDTATAYLRLHGLNEDRYDYDYDYSDAELADPAVDVLSLAEERDRVYCLFNNYEKFENARALRAELRAL